MPYPSRKVYVCYVLSEMDPARSQLGFLSHLPKVETKRGEFLAEITKFTRDFKSLYPVNPLFLKVSNKVCLPLNGLRPLLFGIEGKSLFKESLNRQKVLPDAVIATLPLVIEVVLQQSRVLANLPQIEEGMHDGKKTFCYPDMPSKGQGGLPRTPIR
jgi:hypothetical protein